VQNLLEAVLVPVFYHANAGHANQHLGQQVELFQAVCYANKHFLA